MQKLMAHPASNLHLEFLPWPPIALLFLALLPPCAHPMPFLMQFLLATQCTFSSIWSFSTSISPWCPPTAGGTSPLPDYPSYSTMDAPSHPLVSQLIPNQHELYMPHNSAYLIWCPSSVPHLPAPLFKLCQSLPHLHNNSAICNNQTSL